MKFLILCLSLVAAISSALCSVNYISSDFSLDFETDTGVEASTTVLVGSHASFNKNVNVTWEITKDPNCSFLNSYFLTVSYADCPTCPKSKLFTVEEKYSNITTFPKGLSSSIYAKYFSASATYCAYHVIAKSTSFD
jgi:hypothetical protein